MQNKRRQGKLIKMPRLTVHRRDTALSFVTISGGYCRPNLAQSSAVSSWIFDVYRCDQSPPPLAA